MFGRADLPNGVSLRPSGAGDKDFERMLHEARRWDLWLADAEPDYIQSVVEQQQTAQTLGYGHQFPNAVYYVIEKTGVSCGRLVVDVGEREVRLVDLALIPKAQGAGIGSTVLRALQDIVCKLNVPLALSVQRNNAQAISVYGQLGFKAVQEYCTDVVLTLMWFPDSSWYRTVDAPAEGSGAPEGYRS